MTLKHGFKANAERTAKRYRQELSLSPADPLDPRALADHLDVTIVDAATLVPLADLEELERIQSYAFSAATFEVRERKIVVVNPIRGLGRQNSDIAHELSHIILEHDLSEVRELAGMPFRTCKPEERRRQRRSVERSFFRATCSSLPPGAAPASTPSPTSTQSRWRWLGSGTTQRASASRSQ